MAAGFIRAYHNSEARAVGRYRLPKGFVFSFLLALLCFYPAHSEESWIDIGQLTEARIVSVLKSSQTVRETPAAVHIITSDEIRRSGSTSIPAALRIAPGMEVGRIGSSQWAVSIRGFNQVFANKLLVLMDGRSVYTPSFGGTYWSAQDTLLEDIEQIEIVRGPGGTVWGANAVNGVINIRTKKARDTQGSLISGLAGAEDRGIVGARHGMKLGENVYARVYGKYLNRDASLFANGTSAADDWEMNRGGYRIDWEPESNHSLTFQGDIYDGKIGNSTLTSTLSPPATVRVDERIGSRGHNVLTRWTHQTGDGDELYIQSYYDDWERNSMLLTQHVRTADFDAQYRKEVGDFQTITVGAGYRLLWHQVTPTSTLTVPRPNERFGFARALIQDELSLFNDQATLTLGTKFGHNEFTGDEYQPGARLGIKVAENHFLWTSVSRAIRTPTLVDTDMTVLWNVFPPGSFGPATPMAAIRAQGGGRDLNSEELMAYELGWRSTAIPKVQIDTSLYYNRYEDLHSYVSSPSPRFDPTLPGLAIDNIRMNALSAETYGGEISALWDASSNWRLRTHYSFIKLDLEAVPGSEVAARRFEDGASPEHQIGVQSLLNPTSDIDVDMGVRFVDSVRAAPAYWTADVRLAWRPRSHLEVALVGQNLLSSSRPQFDSSEGGGIQREVQRTVYASLTISF